MYEKILDNKIVVREEEIKKIQDRRQRINMRNKWLQERKQSKTASQR